MSSSPATNVTQLLLEWRGGSQQALDALMPVVYDELRRLAQHYMRGERPEHTLQATALVNEAYLRLVDMKVSWQDRNDEVAEALGISRATVQRELRMAKDWLNHELKSSDER